MTILFNEQRAISGHIIPNKRLSDWESIIEEWTLLIDRFCRIKKRDAPYWYTERANIGVLAGACWRAGYIALEEFQYKKGYSNKPKQNGRADLWIENEKNSTLVEAKYKCISLTSKDISNTLKKILIVACREARKSKGNQSDLDALGMVFVPVYISKKSSLSKINEKIDESVKLIKQNFDGSMIFWHFPTSSRELLGSSNKYYWPGLFVVADRAKA